MASKYIQKFPIPEGFPDILHDMTREVLRYQPENIIEFCALYFECLQEGKELVYSNMGSKIPCDFQNVIPGSRSSERVKQMDKSNYNEAINNCKKISISKGNEEEAVGKSSGFEKKEEEFEKERNNEKIVSSLIDTDEVVMNENQNSFNKTDEDDLREKDSNDNRKDVKRESNFSKTTMEKKEISNNYVNSLLG